MISITRSGYKPINFDPETFRHSPHARPVESISPAYMQPVDLGLCTHEEGDERPLLRAVAQLSAPQIPDTAFDIDWLRNLLYKKYPTNLTK